MEIDEPLTDGNGAKRSTRRKGKKFDGEVQKKAGVWTFVHKGGIAFPMTLTDPTHLVLSQESDS